MQTDSAAWDAKLRQLDASFLQSSAWETFQSASGAAVFKLQADDWACLLVERRSSLRRYLFAPYGPALASAEVLPAAVRTIADFGRQNGYHWVRIEPSLGLSVDSDFADLIKSLPLVTAHKQIDPRYTRMLDLRPDEDDLLAGISASTRSLIRKHGRQPVLEFRTSTDPADMTDFIDMVHTVSERNRVFFHSDEHFLKEAAVLMPRGDMRLELAYLDNKPVACIVMHDFNQVTNYTYAASLPAARQTNASALLLWQAMLNAKAAGISRLDLFGVIPDDSPASHGWAGFSAFKRKFGGTVVKRGPTLDIPLSPRYRLYRAAVDLRRR